MFLEVLQQADVDPNLGDVLQLLVLGAERQVCVPAAFEAAPLGTSEHHQDRRDRWVHTAGAGSTSP